MPIKIFSEIEAIKRTSLGNNEIIILQEKERSNIRWVVLQMHGQAKPYHSKKYPGKILGIFFTKENALCFANAYCFVHTFVA